MPRKKLKKILEVDDLPNVFRHPPAAADRLHEFFGNPQPFTLEIGCGRGDYAIHLAQARPDANFVGVDMKGARLWTGAQTAITLDIRNVAFLRASARDLHEYFREGEVEEIWIPFPDPFPTKKGIARRLTAPGFLEVYRKILRPGGKVHLKTDDEAFFEFTIQTLSEQNIAIIRSSEDIYAEKYKGIVTAIKTKYEERHLAEGKKIKYVCFVL
ncbi:MAG: tRNA (guanosine(46)-N7)-methyltransferase TrmB [Calditrichaeota bacterium]|nr:tRNA (guanosine(46)-N7)-methyltransferase TrmB [Calditrichota bacterium]